MTDPGGKRNPVPDKEGKASGECKKKGFAAATFAGGQPGIVTGAKLFLYSCVC